MSSSLSGRLKARVSRMVQFRPSSVLERNFTILDSEGQARITESLKEHYFTRRIWQDATPSVQAWLASPDGQQDLAMHLWGRTDLFRRTVVPWLNDARPLAGASVLEIGCGTGTSTVALAEQGAHVTGVDIDEPSLKVAEDRCRAYGQTVHLVNINAVDVHRVLAGQHFDFVIFLASVEHMLYLERIEVMQSTWDMLAPGAMWCIADTPNRLWHFDGHTSWLPFYFWLPDDLAFAYSQYSHREPFASSYRKQTPEAMESFLRHGRGVSFHEFELALGKVETLDVVSSLPIFLRQHSAFGLRDLVWRLQRESRFRAFLSAVGPQIHPGFYEPSLGLIIRKH